MTLEEAIIEIADRLRLVLSFSCACDCAHLFQEAKMRRLPHPVEPQLVGRSRGGQPGEASRGNDTGADAAEGGDGDIKSKPAYRHTCGDPPGIGE
jgi:hypothetical protein